MLVRPLADADGDGRRHPLGTVRVDAVEADLVDDRTPGPLQAHQARLHAPDGLLPREVAAVRLPAQGAEVLGENPVLGILSEAIDEDADLGDVGRSRPLTLSPRSRGTRAPRINALRRLPWGSPPASRSSWRMRC